MLVLPFVCLAVLSGTVAARPFPGDAEATSLNVPITANINLSRLLRVVAADQARAAALKNRVGHVGIVHDVLNARQSASLGASNTAVDYTATVNIGNPPTQYTVLLDSGSSNTWVGIKKAYSPSGSSKSTGQAVGVKYGSGTFSGTEYTDRIDLGNGLVVQSQGIGAANQTSGFDGDFDGILGLGPTDLTKGSISGSPDETIPTVTDNLYIQKTIGANVLGFSLPPYPANAAGSISFGGPDSSKYTGQLQYVSITSTQPSSAYWGIDQSVTYGSTTILNSAAGIVDSGTTMILLATDAYDAYKQATGAVLDDKTSMLKLSKDQYNNLQPLHFKIGGEDYVLNANAQIWPRSLNTALGGDNDSIYLVVGDMGSKSGDGFDFINGYMFMERFYTVFDATSSRVGFATTQYTTSDIN